MAKVAGVLQRDSHRQWMPGRARCRLAEKLADVAHPRCERLGTLVAEEPAELLQMRAAARGVDDDEIDVVERVEEPPREGLPFVESPGVHRERSAAALRRSDDLEAVRGEHARGRGIDVREYRALHAAGEQADAAAGRAARGSQSRHVAASSPARRDVHERAEALRHRRGAAEGGEPQRSSHATGIGEESKEEPTDEAVAQRSIELLLDCCARALDEPVVAHARGARRQARHAPEAAIEVLRHGRVERDRPVEPSVHEVDPPARRVHLLAPEHVGRARRQAEAAVDAVGRVLADHAASTPRGSSSRRILSTSTSAPREAPD